MFDVDNFLSRPKALLIAPAGYGKTHFIGSALLRLSGHNLILTHTHAGVASLRQKLCKLGVSPLSYTLETISSFAQKYVHAYTPSSEITYSENMNEYFGLVITKATQLFEKNLIYEVVSETYSGIFVDEYQDCSTSQHAMIMTLARNIPLRILGDPLQGIFDFGEPLVNFSTDLLDFHVERLDVPWRWQHSNPVLGEDLKYIRRCLEDNEKIDIQAFRAVQFKWLPPSNGIQERCSYIHGILNRIGNENLLIISDEISARGVRLALVRQMKGRIHLLEAIDSKFFYDNAKRLNQLTPENFFHIFRTLSLDLFNKTEVNNWLGEHAPKRKRAPEDQKAMIPLQNILGDFSARDLRYMMRDALEIFRQMPGIAIIQHEQFFNLSSALTLACENNESVLNAMIQLRNIQRSKGRNLPRASIGTTLLTKGLEFDNVIVINPHALPNLKHYYVALTRASKRLFLYFDTAH